MKELSLHREELTLRQKVGQIQWFFVLLLFAAAGVGFAMLYSAGGETAGTGSLNPWAYRQMIRFGLGITVMLVVAVIDIRLWLRYAYFFYFVSFMMLVAIELGGAVGIGAHRWINLGLFNIQPSELMKYTMVLALARYFHGGSIEDISSPVFLVTPLLLVAVPAVLVLRQPDLGTTLMLVLAGCVLFFLAGVKLWKFGAVALTAVISAPIAWQFLRGYQKTRVLTFLDPESDPLGAGYHIIQSKIALGSGGLFGKGFMMGSQSHLKFLPEKQTDFIFTMLAEEFGLVGGLGLIGLYCLILGYGFAISLRSRSQFGRLLGLGVTTTFFLYLFINIAMVIGLIPVVGAPLPLVSYGGTAMVAVLFGFGLLLSVYVHRDTQIGRRGTGEEL